MREYLVVRRLVNKEKFNEAIKKTEKIEDPYEKLMTSCLIAEVLVYDDKKEKAISLLNKLFEAAKEIEDNFLQSLSISKIAFSMAIAGNVEEAINMVSEIKFLPEKVYAMARISILLTNKGETERARRILKRAKEIIYKIHDNISKIISIESIAYAFVNIGDMDETRSLMEYAKDIADKLREKDATMVYTLIAKIMMEMGKLEEALEMVEKIKDDYDRAWLLSDVAYTKRDINLLKKAVKIAREMKNRYEKVSIITKVASMMIDFEYREEASELINECIKISEKIGDKIEKAMALAIISHAMFENGDERHISMLDKSMEMVKELGTFDKEYASFLVARVLIEIEKLEEAINFINEIEEEEIRVGVYLSLANDLINEGRKEDAMKIAEFMNDKILIKKIEMD